MSTPGPASGADPPLSVETFLLNVLRSGLLDHVQLTAAVQEVPREERTLAEGIADHMVRTGKLSRYQARKLLKGKWRGIFVGPYQILGPIGKGSSGKVYLARDGRAGGLLALKVLPPHRIKARERLLARF